MLRPLYSQGVLPEMFRVLRRHGGGAALAAAGFDRGANPCSLFPAPWALAGVAF